MSISSKFPLPLILRQNKQNENKNTQLTERSQLAIKRLTSLFTADDLVGEALRLLLKLAHGENPTTEELSFLLLLSTAEALAKKQTQKLKLEKTKCLTELSDETQAAEPK